MSQNKNTPFAKKLSCQLKCFFVSVRFLTIIPFLGVTDDENNYFKGALVYFGSTGLLIGILTGAVIFLSQQIFPPPVTAAFTVISLSLWSGFLHLDGLADTADGFLSNKPKDDCLEIMRDSRIGVMGAVAITSIFLLKYSAIISIFPDRLIVAVILAAIAGRTAIVLSMAALPYARKEGGLGEIFYSVKTKRSALLVLLFFIVISFFIDKKTILPTIMAIFFVTVSFSYLCKKKINGATGDTLGAVCEISETAVLLAISIVF